MDVGESGEKLLQGFLELLVLLVRHDMEARTGEWYGEGAEAGADLHHGGRGGLERGSDQFQGDVVVYQEVLSERLDGPQGVTGQQLAGAPRQGHVKQW